MMNRKILNKKHRKLSGSTKGKLGIELRVLDKNNNILKIGDNIKYGEYTGILLYNYHSEEYGVALDYSQWYGDNKYDINSYGKFVAIPMDNGAKLELERLEAF